MRFFLRMLLIAVFAIAAQLGFGWPWWSIACAGALGGILVSGRGVGAFFSGFFGIGLVWAVWSYQVHTQTDAILSDRVAQIIGLGDNSALLVVLSLVIGGLVGGMGALSGWSINRINAKKSKPRQGYYQG